MFILIFSQKINWDEKNVNIKNIKNINILWINFIIFLENLVGNLNQKVTKKKINIEIFIKKNIFFEIYIYIYIIII